MSTITGKSIGLIFASHSSNADEVVRRPGTDAFATRRLSATPNSGPTETFLMMPVGEIRGYKAGSDTPCVNYEVYGTVPVDARTLKILEMGRLSYPQSKNRDALSELADIKNRESENRYMKERALHAHVVRWEEPTSQSITVPAAANLQARDVATAPGASI